MNIYNCDVLIIGGGIVGLSIAHNLVKAGNNNKIMIIDKESKLGMHSSGRNSGVLHAGLYYKPSSLKAQVCTEGARLLKKWIKEQGLPIFHCGKIIVPTLEEHDNKLEILAEQGESNGAEVEIWGRSQLQEFIPEARSASGRALWSPSTAVVDPKLVMERLTKELMENGVQFLQNRSGWIEREASQQIQLKDGSRVNYGHLINCAGLQADRLAHKFDVGRNYRLLPFKGIYWKLKPSCPIKLRTNLYPVPDINMPFLGIHFTPSTESTPIVSIGPTATPAWGRENYRSLDGLEPIMAAENIILLAKQYLANKNGMRKYVHEQSLLAMKPYMMKAAQDLIPSLKAEDVAQSEKIGIRPQLFDTVQQRLENDFLCLNGPASTHVLNAISPAFTASFALADLIIDKTNVLK